MIGMISCREATRLASESLDHRLPLGKRLALKMHLLMCSLCRNFARQIEFVQEAARRYAELEPDMPSPSGMILSADARRRIVQSLRVQ
jgi:predicted anti-sigma-YlaC factor YlaD